MRWFSNELLFYGGIAIMVIAVLAAILLFFTFRIKILHLNMKLNSEYGEPDA